MKILVVDSALRENGAMRVMLDLSSRWDKRGCPTTFFVLQRVPDESRLRPDVETRYGQSKLGRLRWSLPLIFVRLLWAARLCDVLVSVSEIGYGLLFAAAAARLLRRPLVVVVHTPVADSVQEWVPRGLRWITRRVNRNADAAVCVAQGLVPGVLSNGLPQDRVRVVVNGVDVDRIRTRAFDGVATSGLAELEALSRPLVVGVGRLTGQKGFDVLLNAHARLVRDGWAHSLALVGDGPDRGLLEAMISDLGVASSVRLLGFRDNPHEVVGRADLFCMSSRFEGYPLALLEALAIGVPVVATDCVSGPAEILDEGKYGDLVAVGSVDDLVKAIGNHLADPARLEALAVHGPDRAREFDPDVGAARYLDLFAELVPSR